MKVVGLTGGIASGKSTVSRIFVQAEEEEQKKKENAGRGGARVAVIDLDLIARQVVARGTKAYAQILAQFKDGDEHDGRTGSMLLEPETGEIDRKRLGALVFADPVLRRKLNAITHRPIFFAMLKQMLWHYLKGTDVVILDAPLLYETGLHRLTTSVVVVYVPDDVQLERLKRRDNISTEEAQLKIEAQMPLDKKRDMADFVIDNSGDLQETKRQALAILQRMMAQRGPFFLSWWVFVFLLLIPAIILMWRGV